jgi:hypothetical protein
MQTVQEHDPDIQLLAEILRDLRSTLEAIAIDLEELLDLAHVRIAEEASSNEGGHSVLYTPEGEISSEAYFAWSKRRR